MRENLGDKQPPVWGDELSFTWSLQRHRHRLERPGVAGPSGGPRTQVTFTECHTARDPTEQGPQDATGSFPTRGGKLTEVQESTLKTTPRSVYFMFFPESLVRDVVRFLWKPIFCTFELLKRENRLAKTQKTNNGAEE